MQGKAIPEEGIVTFSKYRKANLFGDWKQITAFSTA